MYDEKRIFNILLWRHNTNVTEVTVNFQQEENYACAWFSLSRYKKLLLLYYDKKKRFSLKMKAKKVERKKKKFEVASRYLINQEECFTKIIFDRSFN